MKIKCLTFFGLFLLTGIAVFSQVSVIPQGFNYQAIARDSLGSPRANQQINLRFTITNQTGTNIPYIETHTRTTDQFGLFTAVIGQGTQTGGTGTFSQIDWKAYNYYIKTEVQEGINYYVIGTEPLMTVPYAMVAKEAVYSTPVGSVIAFTGTSPPSGWLLCDGSEINRTTYSDLFNVIGVSFGYGNNATTFNLPDLRGVFLRGLNGTRNDTIADPDKDSRIASNTGGNTGNNVGSLQDDAFQGHWHREYLGNNNTGSPNSGIYNQNNTYTSDVGVTDPISDGINGTPRTTSETRPKNVYVNYIIKY